MSLTKEHITNSVHNHLGLPKNRSAELVESVLEIMKKTLENGEDVMLGGAGRQAEGILVLELSIPPDK